MTQAYYSNILAITLTTSYISVAYIYIVLRYTLLFGCYTLPRIVLTMLVYINRHNTTIGIIVIVINYSNDYLRY
jgi:hypothetical protein